MFRKGNVSADPSLTGENHRFLWRNVSWALRETWMVHPLLMAGIVFIRIIQSFLPAGLALIGRGLINAVVEVSKVGGSDMGPIIFWLFLGLMLSLADGFCRNSNNFLGRRLHDGLNLKITTNILDHAAGLEVSFFEDPRFQDIMERAQQNTAGHFSQFITDILQAATNVFQILSLMVIMVVIEPLTVLIILLAGLPYFFLQWRLARTRFLKEYSRATKRRWTRYYVSRMTSQRTVSEVKLLGLAPLLIDKFRALLSEFMDQDRKLYIKSFQGGTVYAILSTIAFYGIFTRVVIRALRGALTIGDVAVFGGIAARLGRAIENTIMSITSALEQTLHISNLVTFLNLEPRMVLDPGVTPSAGRGEIVIENLSFTYPGTDRPVLSGINLHIRAGETIAIVGENGAGKTTLVKLITRLYDPDEGVILFDGNDLRNLSADFLRRQLSFIFQEFGRYEATAADNIAYGNWREVLEDRQRIEKAARLCGVHEMIEGMPQGYDTLLGRMFGEYTLSGGQWQKIAMARAFTKEASLLILDEPTSNLDARSEYLLYSRFGELSKGRTTILISHRFSTVQMADRIVVLHMGRLIEEGTHQELLDKKGHYAGFYELYRRQLNGLPS